MAVQSGANKAPAEPVTFRAALVQICAGREVEPTLAMVERLVEQAAAAGADYVQTPENTAIMELDLARLRVRVQREPDHRALAALQALARRLAIWLHIGSLAVVGPDGGLRNRSYLIDPDGQIRARYDKIHMFDVTLPGGEVYHESANYVPGDRAVVAALPWGRLGLSICYDLRFAQLYRRMAQAGAGLLAVPAAFTAQTGKAHWHVLLRARAIETGSFVLAAGQAGHHENGRETYGHSLIISPWGEVLAEAGDEPCVIHADIDMGEIDKARRILPSLKHDRDFIIDTL